MPLKQLFKSIEKTILAKYEQSSCIYHQGDKGENREEFLIEFLREHLPLKYGITKGEVMTIHGERSHAIDIIIYDALNCPVFYSGKTKILPIEGVYGIIEVKSSLSKAELLDAASKIEKFKRLAPRELSVIEKEKYVTVRRASRPFGIVLGYSLANNSLNSLKENWQTQTQQVYDVNFFANLICVLGEGIIHIHQYNLSQGTHNPLLDTDEFVDLVLTAKNRQNNGQVSDEIIMKYLVDEVKDLSLGRFMTYLQVMLNRMRLNQPDLTRYIDPELDMTVIKE